MSVVLTDVLSPWQPAIEGDGSHQHPDRGEPGRWPPARGARAAAGARVFAGNRHHLVVPGLVNAHFHSPPTTSGVRCRACRWRSLMLYESPAADELRPAPREAYLRTLLGVIEMLHGGEDEAAGRRLPHAGTGCRDDRRGDGRVPGRGHPRERVALDQPELPETDKLPFLEELATEAPPDVAAGSRPGPMAADELLEHYRHLFATWHGAAGGRLAAAVRLRAAAGQPRGAGYRLALDALSAEHDVPLFAHMLEHPAGAGHRHPRFGSSLVRYTADLGLLTSRTNVIHAVWGAEPGLDLLASSGANVACTTRNLPLGSGVMPWRPMREPRRCRSPRRRRGNLQRRRRHAGAWCATGLVHNVTDPDPDRGRDGGGGARLPVAGRRLGSVAGGRPGLGRGGQELADLAVLDLHGAASVRDALRPRRAARVPGGRAGRRPHHGGRADRRRREGARRGRGRRARRVAGDLRRETLGARARARTPAASCPFTAE